MIDEDVGSIVFALLICKVKTKQHASKNTDIDLMQTCHFTIQTFGVAQS